MRFTTAAAISGLAAVAVAESNGTWSEGHGGSWGPKSDSWGSSASNVWVTEVVTAFTTYCPEATQITHGGSTYSVTSATTLTITNCPGGCTITKPVSSSTPVASSPVAPVTTSTSASAVVPSKPASSAAASSAKASVGTVAPYKPSNGTAVTTAKPTGTGSWTSASASATSVAPYKGDATKASFGIAGLIAAVGLVAAL